MDGIQIHQHDVFVIFLTKMNGGRHVNEFHLNILNIYTAHIADTSGKIYSENAPRKVIAACLVPW